MKLNWTSLDKFLDQTVAKKINTTPYITEIFLGEANSWGEWHRNEALGHLMSLCPKLNTLYLTISGTSNWIKYIEPSIHQLKEVVVYSEVAIVHRNFTNNQNLKLPIFNIEDLTKFPNVDTLRLEGFNVRIEKDQDEEDYIDDMSSQSMIEHSTKIASGLDDEYNTTTSQASKSNGARRNHPQPPKITSLYLRNCIWDYPYSIQDFGPIKTLSVIYSSNYDFLMNSERVKSFAQDPPESVEHLTLQFLNVYSLKHISWIPLSHLLKQKRRNSVERTIKEQHENGGYSSLSHHYSDVASSSSSSPTQDDPLITYSSPPYPNLKTIDLKGFDLPPSEFFANLPPSVTDLTFHIDYNLSSMNPQAYIDKIRAAFPNLNIHLDAVGFELLG